jgi:tetratricopeptide (TPR) repeat protein
MPLPSESDLDLAAGDLKEEILIPPDPSEVAAAERQRVKVKAKPIEPVKEGKARKTFVLVGSAVLVLALAGGAFLFLNKDRFFPNSQTEEPAAGGNDPIARATDLHQKGQTDKAIRQLSLVSPEDPSFRQAQQLIAQWRADQPAPTATAAVPLPAPTPPPIPPERLALLGAAREAYEGRRYLEAIDRFEEAQEKAQLDAADAELLASAKRQLEPIAAQVNLFEQHEWEPALRDLWRLREKDPDNPDITRLMVDSYYNLGLRELQRMDTARAAANFKEGLGLDPGDKDLQRQLLFAQTYQERSKDMLYRIYVKHLPVR